MAVKKKTVLNPVHAARTDHHSQTRACFGMTEKRHRRAPRGVSDREVRRPVFAIFPPKRLRDRRSARGHMRKCRSALQLNLASTAVLRQVVEQVPIVPRLSLRKATPAVPLNIALGAAQPHLIDVNDAFCGTGHAATAGRQTRASRHYQDCGTGRAHDPKQAESSSLQHAPILHHPEAARTNSETPPQKQKDALSQQHSKGNPASSAPSRPPHTSPHLKPCPLESRVQFFHHVLSSLGRAAGVRR